MPHNSLLRVVGALAVLGLLSACAGKPQLTAQQEASDYRGRAAHSYVPPGPRSDPWGPYIVEASQRFDVPERWIREVMRQESGGKALAASGPGAMGLMQVMPGTYDELRGRYRDLGSDAFDPHDNLMAGTAYIRELYDIYGSPGFLAAYNAGPGRLDDYLTRGRTLPNETRRYVAAIGPRIADATPSHASQGGALAMNALPMQIADGSRYARDSRYSTVPDARPASQPAEPVQVASLPPPAGPRIVLGEPTPLAAFTPAPRIVLGRPTPPDQFDARPTPPDQFNARPTPPEQFASATPQPITLGQPTPVEQFESFAPRSAPAEAARNEPRTRLGRQAAPELASPPMPSPQVAAYAPPARGGFRIVAPAMAEPIARPRGPVALGGNWAVQVGALANDRLAAAEIANAKDKARELANTHGTVTGVRQGSAMLFRARLNGLSREGAQQACERLVHQHMNCILVSPDAQS